MARTLDEDQAIIGIAARDSVGAMREFVERHGLAAVPNVADPDGELWERLGVFGQPTWAYVDSATGEVSVRFGLLGAEGVRQVFADGGFG